MDSTNSHVNQHHPSHSVSPENRSPSTPLISIWVKLPEEARESSFASFHSLPETDDCVRMCVGGVLGIGQGFPDNLAIIGDAFLKSCESTYT